MRFIAAACALSLGSFPSVASACVDPPEQWYEEVSDIIFDGSARCDQDRGSCTIRVTKILKNSLKLPVTGGAIEIDFYNWFKDPSNVGPDEIVLACGVPVFEPELTSFRGRFYANRDPKSLELRVRRHLVRSSDRRLWSPYDCEEIDGKIVCKEYE